MTTKTKSFHSGMAGAPVLNGVAASLIGVLDVLTTGFGLQSVSALNVLGGVATATVASTPSAGVDTVILVAGAANTLLNGEQRVTSVNGNSVSWPTTAPDGAATGSITIKVAPAGWAKSFSDAGLACYKSLSAEGTGCYLRVDDTGTTTARVRGYETMSDAATGTGLFPTLSQIPDAGLYWSKSATADATARAWYVVGDSRGFYLFVNNYGTSSAFQSYYFGDVLSLKSNDPYACVLRANNANRSASTGMEVDDLGYADSNGTSPGMYVARAANTLGGSVQAYSCPTMTVGLGLQHVTGSTGWTYPSPVDNGLTLSPMVLHSAGTGYRGYFPGLRTSPQITNNSFSTGDYVQGSGSMAGKKVMVIEVGASTAGSQQGVLFMDPISDWRI